MGVVPIKDLYPDAWLMGLPGGAELEVARGLRPNLTFVGKLEAFHPWTLSTHTPALLAGLRFGRLKDTDNHLRGAVVTLEAGIGLWPAFLVRDDLEPTEAIDRAPVPGLLDARVAVPVKSNSRGTGYVLAGTRFSSDLPIRRVHHPDDSVSNSIEPSYASSVLGGYAGGGWAFAWNKGLGLYYLEAYAGLDTGLANFAGALYPAIYLRIGTGNR